VEGFDRALPLAIMGATATANQCAGSAMINMAAARVPTTHAMPQTIMAPVIPWAREVMLFDIVLLLLLWHHAIQGREGLGGTMPC
jgi:hypothetical protein